MDSELGRLLIAARVLLAILGVGLSLGTSLHLGRLPGRRRQAPHQPTGADGRQ
jgi:hypothetical protein